MIFLAIVITALLLPLVAVMVWRCWNLPPVPVIRLWALAFGGMSAGMLYQFWRAEAWKAVSEKLELKLQEQRLLPKRQVLSKTISAYRGRTLLDVGDRYAPQFASVQFPALIIQCDPGTMSLVVHL